MFIRAVVLEVDGIKIIGRLYLPDGQIPFPTVCICHGIPATHPDPHDEGYRPLAESICSLGFAVFTFNFRGTGDSGGNLDILGWTRDLKAVVDYLCTLQEVDRSYLALLGFSGGAAVSIYEAAQDSRPSHIIACACPAEFARFKQSDSPQSFIDHFRSIGAIRDGDFPESIEEWLDGFEIITPSRYVALIAPRPLLLVYGSCDDMVETSHVYKLYNAAGEPKQVVIVDGAEHKLRTSDRAMDIVINWLKSQYQQRFAK